MKQLSIVWIFAGASKAMKSKRQLIQIYMTMGDTLLMYLSIFLSLIIRYQDFSFLRNKILVNHIIFFTFIQLLWLVFLFFLDFYEIPPIKDFLDYFGRLIIFVLLCFATGSIYFYFIPRNAIAPKTVLFIDVLVMATLISCFRLAINFLLKGLGFFEGLIFIGSERELDQILPEVIAASSYKIIGVYNMNHVLNPSFSKEELLEMAPDLVILSNDFYNNKEFADKIFTHLPLGLNYISFTDFYEDVYGKIPIDLLNEMWLLDRMGKKLDVAEFTKRIFDIVFSSIGLLITIIIFPFVALALKATSRGPIFYKQQRVGARGKTFSLIKFRTMRSDAEANGPQWSRKNDPRTTKVGKLLRYTHIDEFPQFFNILKGDISFVGPRPERPEFVRALEKDIPFYDIRHFIQPGLTGWAQINYDYGSSTSDAKEKLQYDLYYISNRCIALDLAILLKTIRQMF